MQITDVQRIRIALAFVALRHKPKDASYGGAADFAPFVERRLLILMSLSVRQAYVLDLQDRFPLAKDRRTIVDEPWRDRALKLEEEVNKLKRKYEEDLAELNVFRENARPDGAAKKKKRPNPAAERREGNDARSALLQSIETATGDFSAKIHAPELSGALDLFKSYYKLFQLSSRLRSQSTLSSHSTQLLVRSATDVLRALAKALETARNPEGCLEMSVDFMNDFNSILYSTLSRIVSLLLPAGTGSRKKRPESASTDNLLDTLFSTLASDIVVPLIKSFARISENTLLSALSTRRQRRADGGSKFAGSKAVLHSLVMLLKSVIANFSKTSTAHGRKLLEVIKLSVITEIERLWLPSGGSWLDSGDSLLTDIEPVDACMRPIAKLSRQERIHRLSRKTALWYLCAVAHDVLVSSSPASRSGTVSLDVAQDRLDITLSRLLVRCSSSVYVSSGLKPRDNLGMTDVEKGMIGSVIENIWMSQ